MKSAPPGWEPHKVMTRIDGWVVDPADENRIPAAVAQMIARTMPQPGDHSVVAVISARMYGRHKRVLGYV